MKEWNTTYESLAKFVVPGSSRYVNIMLLSLVVYNLLRVVREDNDFCLCSVVVFKKYMEDFKTKAREARFNVRDYTFDEERISEAQAQKTQLEEDKEKHEVEYKYLLFFSWVLSNKQASLTRFLKVAFSQAYADYFHLKAIRVFVESVLRYGLPVNYQYAIVTVRSCFGGFM